MEGDPQEQDSRFAEWYVWSKREVSTENGVSLGAAQAAMEAVEKGADEQAARRAARGSTAGHSLALASRITPRRRAYAEWYDWARRELGGGRDRQHVAARAAIDRLDSGGDAGAAAAAARAAVGPIPSAPAPYQRLVTTPAPVEGPPGGPPGPTGGPPGGPPGPPGAPPGPPGSPGAPPGSPGGPPPSPSSQAFVAPAPPAYAGPVRPLYGVQQPAHTVQAPPPLAPSHVYAGFWRRTGAWAIDTVLLTIGLVVLEVVGSFFALVGLASSGQDITNEAALGVQLALFVIMFVLAWLYYAGLEGSPWQGTVGKRLFRLMVTDQYGRRIHFGRASGRFFGKIVSALALFVGYLMVAFSERKQGLHDLMAGTLVVRQQHLAELTAPSPPALPQPSGQPGTGEVQGA